MSNTLPDVQLPENTWVNLYSSTGITVGTAVNVTNKGSYPILLAVSVSSPVSSTIGAPLHPGPFGSVAFVDAGESGLWARATVGTSQVLVQES
jgi:hypothetical protein